MFQFYYSIIPVPLITYIQKLQERAPIAGKLSAKIICSEQDTPAESGLLNPTTIVIVFWIFGLIVLTAVVLIVKGFGLALEAVQRLTHEVAVFVVPNSMQEEGVIRLGQIGKTTIIYDVASMLLISSKLKIKLDGDNYVFGDATTGAVGCSPFAGINTRHIMSIINIRCRREGFGMVSIRLQLRNLQLLYFYYLNIDFHRLQLIVNMQQVSIVPLGAGCEVGRSCLILTINNKKIMLDCGLMINKQDTDSLPLFDRVNPQQLSMVIITHAHLDHCGALPYFLARFNYKKKVYMTKPTKDIYHYLVRDTAKVQKDKALFNNQQIEDSLSRIYPVEFGVQTEEQGIKITPYVAGHIVGAAMFIIQVDGVKILYTGDYSCEEDRYIMKAQIPQSNVDILISQSTFGIRVHQNRRMREQKFQQYVRKIVKGGGKCLLPVFSAGRAEQLLFILDQYWEQNKEELQHIQIYYTVSLIDKCRDIYQTYIDMLSKKIRERFYKQEANPFKYRHIHYLKKNTRIYSQENNPMVVMCTPGMLQNGQSRTLLERWCHDPKNGVCITGYCAQGSIASNLKKGDCIPSMQNNKPITVNLSVEEISFAAHADCAQTTQFIKRLNPSHVVLVHGSGKNAQNLREYISKQFKDITSVNCPKNEQELKFEIEISQKYHIAGQLKTKIQQIIKKQAISHQQQFEGYVFNNGNQKVLVQDKDKNIFFPQSRGLDIKERIFVNYIGTMTLAHILAERIFGKTSKAVEDGNEVLVIKNDIKMIITEPKKKALVQFISSKKNDIIADQFCYLLSNIFLDPFEQPDKSIVVGYSNKNEAEKLKRQLIAKIIKQQYPQSITASDSFIVVIRNQNNLATINLDERRVDCKDQYMRMRFYGIIDQYFGEYNDAAEQMEEQKQSN